MHKGIIKYVAENKAKGVRCMENIVSVSMQLIMLCTVKHLEQEHIVSTQMSWKHADDLFTGFKYSVVFAKQDK